jgi:HK97 family phage prohead protease
MQAQSTVGFSAIGSDFVLKSADGADLFVAGYASVDMVDKQGDRIPVSALKKAFSKFMNNKAFRNVQLAHSGIQVGEVVNSYTDSQNRVWKSEVDDHGLFVVCKIRDDIQKAREVQKQVRDGELRSFSIGGQALFRVTKTTPELGTHREITDLELHEITLCKKGINPESNYTILKMDDEDDTMTNAETLNEIRNGLSRVLSHLDGDEIVKGDYMDKNMTCSMCKGDEAGCENCSPKETKKSDNMSGNENNAMAYIDTLEKFAHEAGVNLDEVRTHFGLEKAYMQEGSGGYSHRGQGDEYGSGEDATEPTYPTLPSPSGNQTVIKTNVPSMGYNAPSGNKNVIKGEDLTPAALERGYNAYAAIRDEQSLKGLVEKEWKERYEAETLQALEIQKQSDFGGQIAALRNEIQSLRTENSDLQKSATPTPTETTVRVPSHEEFNAMGSGIDGWRAAEDLARRALRGE